MKRVYIGAIYTHTQKKRNIYYIRKRKNEEKKGKSYKEKVRYGHGDGYNLIEKGK